MDKITRWQTITTNVDVETGEIIEPQKMPNYIKVKCSKTTKIFTYGQKNYGEIQLIWECIQNQQTKLEI